MSAPTCKKVCAGKKRNIMYEQCRDEGGKVVSMRRVGVCSGERAIETDDVRIVEKEVE